MSAYAIANIQSIRMGPDVVEYLERIDATLAPYRHSGRRIESRAYLQLVRSVPVRRLLALEGRGALIAPAGVKEAQRRGRSASELQR